jgi:murein DD-endopeptidase MepM/ murein hydrolase activator NlpD
MKKDERFYAFIVARTSRHCSRIRHVSIHERWIQAAVCAAAVVCCAALYGFYGLAQQAAHLRIEQENERLREENERQRRQLDHLKNRVEAIEDASRRLSEISGVSPEEDLSLVGAGGPLVILDAAAIALVEARAAQLEQELRTHEQVLVERARIPSIWPTEGRITDDYGPRHNPFGGGMSEFHDGLDIAAAWGTPVVATGGGTVLFAGAKSGYGNVVEVDHGGGLMTAYGHLSKIEVAAGQELKRGDAIGRVGSTGRSTGPHVHYEVRIGDSPVSPAHYLPARTPAAPSGTN